MPELRQNIINGDWVVIAPERAKRPKDFVIPKGIKVADKSNCPFCLDNPNRDKRIKFEEKTPNIYVLQNRYPAFLENESGKSVRSFYPEESFYRARASVGDHEVVIIKNHDLDIYGFGPRLMVELFEVIQDRYLAMKQDKKIASIMPIYNHGGEAGASIAHPHAQIFASGIVANTVGREIDGAERYYGINGTCVYCDIIAHEKKEKYRIVSQNDNFIAITPYASRFPFETWILPKEHESQFELSSKTDLVDFSETCAKVISMIGETLDKPPLNFYLHTLPTIHESSSSYHWHLEIAPRVSRYGGFELGSEIIINTMPPEEAASYLKEKK